MENDSLKTISKSPARWDASTYEASYVDAVRLIIQTLEPLIKTINLPKDASVLEMGAGGGKWSCAFSIMGYDVTAMDNNPEMLEQISRNFPNVKINHLLHDISCLEKDSLLKKYDLVFSEGVNEHFLDYNKRINAIKAMKHCCIEGGYVFFYVPFLSDKPDEHRYTSMREMELEVREAGLESVLVDIGMFRTATQIHTMLRVLAKKR